MKRLYVGNVPFNLCTDEGLRELFAGFTVESTHIVMDKEQGRPRGFCFVELTDPKTAQEAIEELHDSVFHGRNVTIRLAHDKQQDRRSQRNERRARN